MTHSNKVVVAQRRTWNKEEYAEKAEKRAANEKKELSNLDLDAVYNKQTVRRLQNKNNRAIIKRDLLRPRTFDIKLNAKIGQRLEVSTVTPLQERGGWFCDICQCQLKDSHTFLDHINGKNHQKALGMNMRVSQSTVTQVKNRLEYHRKRKHAELEGFTEDVTDRLAMKQQRKRRKHEQQKLYKMQKRMAKKQAMMDNSPKSLDFVKNYNFMANAKNENKPSINVACNENEYVLEARDPEMLSLGFDFSFGGGVRTKKKGNTTKKAVVDNSNINEENNMISGTKVEGDGIAKNNE